MTKVAYQYHSHEQKYEHIYNSYSSNRLYADTLQYKLKDKHDIIRIKSPENGTGVWQHSDIVKKTTENIQNALSKTEAISENKLFVENILKFAQQQQSVGNTPKGEKDWIGFCSKKRSKNHTQRD